MQINACALLGLGAVGTAYSQKLESHPGFFVLADPTRAARLREGVTLNGQPYLPRVRTPNESGSVDLLIFATKSYHLQAAMETAASLVGENTLLLSLLNGLTSEDILGARFGEEKLLYGFTVGIDAQREGDKITCGSAGRIVLGEKNNQKTERLLAVQAYLQAAGIKAEIPEDIRREMWWKLLVNAGINQCSAVLGAPYGLFTKSELARNMMLRAQREALRVANAEGVQLTEEDIDRWLALLATLDPEAKTSMLQDREAGRPTEAELFGGYIGELGRRHGIPTPVNDWLYNSLQLLAREDVESARAEATLPFKQKDESIKKD